MRNLLFILAFAVTAPALAADLSKGAAAQPKADQEKLICRREVPIGSLIASRKTCLTALQWQKQAEDAQAALDRMNPHLSTEHGN